MPGKVPISDTIKRMVQARANKPNTNMSSEHWGKTKGLIAIYKTLRRNKFFGHGSWPTYLEKEIGITPQNRGWSKKK